MTTAERIRLLRRHGLENAVIAAVLGVNCDAIADHIADPSIDVAIPGGGGGGDVSGLLPLDGSRAMTGPLEFGSADTTIRLDDAGNLLLYNNAAGYIMADGSGGLWAAPSDALDFSGSYAGVDPSGFLELAGESTHIDFGPVGAPPDVILKRDATGIYQDTGVGDLRIVGQHALIFGLDVDYAQEGGYVGRDGAYWQTAPDDPYAGSVNIHKFGVIDVHSANGFVEIADGALNFASAGGAIDASLGRTAPGTLEIDHTLSFKGTSSDIHAGATLEWSDDWYGLVLKGRPGSGDAELYLIDPDDENNNWVNIYPSAVFGKHGNGNYFSLAASGLAFTGTPTTITMVSPDGVQHPVTMNDDGTLSVATGGSGGGGASASFEFENDGPGGEGPFVIISIGRLAGDPGYVGYGLAQITRTQGDLNDVGLDLRMVPTGGGNVRQFSILMDGTIGWHNGGGGSDPDVQLRRAGAGVLEVPQHGGGFKLTSPDGSQTKTLRLSNAGALELV